VSPDPQNPVPPATSGPASAPAPADDGDIFLSHTLPNGTMVGGLQITGLIGEGGFGIVYLAFDTTLQRQVALKEYMPSSLASRVSGSHKVRVNSPRFVDTFNAGLRSFINEARLLASFDHPALVKVHQFWQANDTAYMVMPYYQGPTLKAHVAKLAAAGSRPDEAMLRQWLAPLLDALATMHAGKCYHRDIAPDNILLTNNGPLLLDFGAARRVISDMTQALTVILKPGYAPIEQYGDVATMTQGPWTDLYALASVIYYCITGHSPITSVERVMGDPLPRLARVAAGQYGSAFLAAVDAALAVRPADRPQSVAEFRDLLDGRAQPRPPSAEANVAAGLPANAAAPAVPAAFALDKTQPRPPTEGGYAPTMPMAGPAAAGAAAGAAAPAKAQAAPARAAAQAPAAGGSGAAAAPAPALATASKRGPLVGAVAAIAALAVGAGVFMQGGGTPTPAAAPNTAPAPNADPAAMPALAPAVAPAVTPTAAPAVTPTAAPAIAPALTPAAPPSFSSNEPPAAAPPRAARAPASSAFARGAAQRPAASRPSDGPRQTAQRAARNAPAPVAQSTPPADRGNGNGVRAYPVPGGTPAPAATTPPAAATTASPPPAPARAANAQATKCAELLKKGNQGTLTLEDATFLRKECR